VIIVLGSISKALATMATQPLIVAKVGLQSKPPPVRNGKPFKSFIEVMRFIVEHEGLLGLFKGIGPQIMKGLLVQGFLMMAKERYVLSSISSYLALTSPAESSWPSYYCSDMSDKSAPKSSRNSPNTLPRRPDKAALFLSSRNLSISVRFSHSQSVVYWYDVIVSTWWSALGHSF